MVTAPKSLPSKVNPQTEGYLPAAVTGAGKPRLAKQVAVIWVDHVAGIIGPIPLAPRILAASHQGTDRIIEAFGPARREVKR